MCASKLATSPVKTESTLPSPVKIDMISELGFVYRFVKTSLRNMFKVCGAIHQSIHQSKTSSLPKDRAHIQSNLVRWTIPRFNAIYGAIEQLPCHWLVLVRLSYREYGGSFTCKCSTSSGDRGSNWATSSGGWHLRRKNSVQKPSDLSCSSSSSSSS